MRYFYLNNEQLEKGYPAVLTTSDIQLEKYETNFLEKGILAREYMGEFLPERLIYDDKLKEVRIATEQECYDLDPVNYILKEDIHYLKNGEIKIKSEYPQYMLKPFFSVGKEKWEETATNLEIKNYESEVYKSFYYSELNNFGKVIFEYNAGVKTKVEYEKCQEYIRLLVAQLNLDIRTKVERPDAMIY